MDLSSKITIIGMNLSEEKHLLLFDNILSCFKEFNFFAPFFIADLTMESLKKNMKKADLQLELGKYIPQYELETLKLVIDWFVFLRLILLEFQRYLFVLILVIHQQEFHIFSNPRDESLLSNSEAKTFIIVLSY